MIKNNSSQVAIIVAHPDDETLWAGGTILSHPSWQSFIVCLCRGSDPDRAPKYYKTMDILKAKGAMGNLDDGPAQLPLNDQTIDSAILDLLPHKKYDLVISHNPKGEYTRHIRHEETGKAVIRLWFEGKILSKALWTFSYEDGGGNYFPKPVITSPVYQILTKKIFMKKYSIMTDIYGFKSDSWEAKTTPKNESFLPFTNSSVARKWFIKTI